MPGRHLEKRPCSSRRESFFVKPRRVSSRSNSAHIRNSSSEEQSKRRLLTRVGRRMPPCIDGIGATSRNLIAMAGNEAADQVLRARARRARTRARREARQGLLTKRQAVDPKSTSRGAGCSSGSVSRRRNWGSTKAKQTLLCIPSRRRCLSLRNVGPPRWSLPSFDFQGTTFQNAERRPSSQFAQRDEQLI